MFQRNISDQTSRNYNLSLYRLILLICLLLLSGCIIDDKVTVESDAEDEVTNEMGEIGEVEEVDGIGEMEEIELSDNATLLDCPEPELGPVLSEITACEPSQISRGQELDLRIYAEDIDCKASLIIIGGGIETLIEPRVYKLINEQSQRVI